MILIHTKIFSKKKKEKKRQYGRERYKNISKDEKLKACLA